MTRRFSSSSIISVIFVLYLFQGGYSSPTTPYIQQVFLGKCYEQNPVQSTTTNCSQLWSTFSYGAMMDLNRVKNSDFQPFYSIANFTAGPDLALFWSGSKDFATRLASDGSYFTTLEETSTGYILNGLTWCGNTYQAGVPPSFDYINNCPFQGNSTYYGNQGVWNQASQLFASTASGNVNVLLQPQPLNYNSGPYIAFRNTSIFYNVEFPNMNPKLIKDIRILLIVDTINAPSEKCGNGSLKLLSDMIYKKFLFTPQCVDNPEDIVDILCARENNSPECQLAQKCQKTNPSSEDILPPENTPVTQNPLFPVIVVLSVVCGVLLFVVVVTSRKKNKGYSPLNLNDTV